MPYEAGKKGATKNLKNLYIPGPRGSSARRVRQPVARNGACTVVRKYSCGSHAFPVSAPRGSRIPEITGTARPRLKAESDPRSSTLRIRTSGKKGSSSAGSGQANVPSFSLAFWLDAHSDSALAPQSNAKASQERVERLSRSRACNTDLSHSGSLEQLASYPFISGSGLEISMKTASHAQSKSRSRPITPGRR